MGLCVPASCSANDIEKALSGPYEKFGRKNNLIIKVEVDENNCQAYHEEPTFSTGAIIYWYVLIGYFAYIFIYKITKTNWLLIFFFFFFFFCILFLCSILLFVIFALVVVSSLYDDTIADEDVEKESTSNLKTFLLCFSLKRNLKTIFAVNYKHRGLDTIHFLRFFSMCCVLLGHRMMQYYFNPVVNKRYLEMVSYFSFLEFFFYFCIKNAAIYTDQSMLFQSSALLFK